MKNAARNYSEAIQLHNKKAYAKAFPLFESAAQRGLPEAQVYMGMYYDYGYYVPQNKATAFSYWPPSRAMPGVSARWVPAI